MIPNDPAILLERKTIEDKLSLIGYKYSEERNQFI